MVYIIIFLILCSYFYGVYKDTNTYKPTTSDIIVIDTFLYIIPMILTITILMYKG